MKQLSLKSNLIWNSAGSFTYLFCQWILTLIVIRLSNDFSNAGNFALAISITNIFYNLACFNVRPYLVSDTNSKYEVEDYISFRIVTCVLATILCFLYILFFDYSQSQVLCIILYMIYKIGEAIADLFHSFEQRKSRMDIGGISLFSRGILSLICFYIGLKVTGQVNFAIIIMTIVTWIFIFTFDYQNVKKFEQIKVSINKQKIMKLFVEFTPLTIGSFIGTISTSLPRQFLESSSGTEMLGIYGTVATPAVIVQVASSYIYNPLLVHFANYKSNKDKKNFTFLFLKVTGVILVASIVFLIGSYLFAEWGLNLLYGKRIADYAYLFIPVIIYTSLNGFMWFCYNILIILRKLKSILLINLCGFIICVSTSTYLINVYGMNGVSYSLIVFTVIMIIAMLLLIFYKIKSLDKK